MFLQTIVMLYYGVCCAIVLGHGALIRPLNELILISEPFRQRQIYLHISVLLHHINPLSR